MKLALCGLGRAGKEFVRYVTEKGQDDLVAVLCRDGSSTAGKIVSDITEIATDRELVIQKISECTFPEKPDVLVDFSACNTSIQLLDMCVKEHINLIICPTDFTDEQLVYIESQAKRDEIGVVFAPTLTSGVNLTMEFVQRLSKIFQDYQFEIIERHPKNKPVPTKTSKKIAAVIDRDSVPISSVRLDGYVGIHEVTATDGYERISITHESFSRDAFVRGALLGANFIKDKKGYYTMSDIVHDMFISEWI